MSETILPIPLPDVTTFRISCLRCNRGVVEVPLDRLNTVFNSGQCRFCNHRIFPAGKADVLLRLKAALEDLAFFKAQLSVEAVLPQQS